MSSFDDVLRGFTSNESASMAQRAIDELDGASSVVLVEGVSDQIAVETLARARAEDMAGVVVFPAGGVHSGLR